MPDDLLDDLRRLQAFADGCTENPPPWLETVCGRAAVEIERLRAENAELKAIKVAVQEAPKQWSTALAPTMEAIAATARQIATERENERLRNLLDKSLRLLDTDEDVHEPQPHHPLLTACAGARLTLRCWAEEIREKAAEIERLRAALTVRTMACTQAKALLTKLHGILRHKQILPEMMPGVQKRLEEECAAALRALDVPVGGSAARATIDARREAVAAAAQAWAADGPQLTVNGVLVNPYARPSARALWDAVRALEEVTHADRG